MDYIIKTNTFKNPSAVGADLMAEVEGTVQGHRDGHGFVVRDDRQADLYLSQQEMRAVLHRDRVKARIVRYDRKGRNWVPLLPGFSGDQIDRSPDGQWLVYRKFPGDELH